MEKLFKKQTKPIKDQASEQVYASNSLQVYGDELPSIKDFILKEKLNPEFVDQIKKIEEEKQKADISKIVYKGYDKTFDFRKFKMTLAFGNDIKSKSWLYILQMINKTI